MWTGRETLSSIERALARLNTEETELDEAMRQAAGEAERLRRERADALSELARIKLDEIAAGRLIRNLDAGERRAVQMLADRRDRLAALGEQRTAAIGEVQQAEAARHAAAAQVEERLEAVAALRVEVEQKVTATREWVAARAQFEAEGAVASEAEKKATQSEQELSAKKKPYDEDPLFIYLWRREFGTPRYAASNLVRYMDRRVADFIGFLTVRPNYVMLTEIPLRLREHARDRRRQADARQAALGDIERRAMEAAGIESRERALAEARHRLAAADAAVERKRAQLKTLDEERDRLLAAGGEEAARQAAIDEIARADALDSIATLLAEARRTPTPADEEMVRRIEALDPRIRDAENEAGELRRAARALAERRLEVERTRDRFRGSGYDHPDAVFSNEGAIAEILEQLVRGVVRSGALWDLIRAGFGTRARRRQPGFGGSGLPFPFPLPGGGMGPRGGEWREPSSRGGWSPGSSSGSSGGGDFTTGGSF